MDLAPAGTFPATSGSHSLALNGLTPGQHRLWLSCNDTTVDVTFTVLPRAGAGEALLPTLFGQQERSPVMNMIGFSKDRAAQLDLLLHRCDTALPQLAAREGGAFGRRPGGGGVAQLFPRDR